MKIAVIVMVLCSILFLGCAAAMVGAGAASAISASDRAKTKENWINKQYEIQEDKIWQLSLSVCEERGYSLKIHDKGSGYIETDWKVQERADPDSLILRIKKYGEPIDAGDIKWDGMKYRLLIFITQMGPKDTKIRLRADLRARTSSGSNIWRWCNSNGTLEEMFLAHLETRMGYDSSQP